MDFTNPARRIDEKALLASKMADLYALVMRTTLDIPESLLNEAQKASRLSSKREAVIAGLEELIRKAHREELRKLAGRVELEVDLGKARQR